jgi:hypothetical protein
VIGEELCEIAGIGPISVRQARAILGDAVLRLVITDGIDVRNVTTLAHRPTMAMHYAMLWSNPCCVAEGCGNTILQFDHRTGTEYADTRHTRLAELDHLCTFHHMLHTRHRWALVAGDGTRPMVPPEDSRHPLFRPPPGTEACEPSVMSNDELDDLAQLLRHAYEASGRTLADATATAPARSP